jgi:hypothetical protein
MAVSDYAICAHKHDKGVPDVAIAHADSGSTRLYSRIAKERPISLRLGKFQSGILRLDSRGQLRVRHFSTAVYTSIGFQVLRSKMRKVLARQGS